MFGNNDPLKKLLILQAIGPSENPLCKCRVAPGMAMTVGMIMVLPPSHSPAMQDHAMGAALSERQLGWNSREVVSRPPLDDFPGLRPEHTGCRGQIVCYISDRHRKERPNTIEIQPPENHNGQVCFSTLSGKLGVRLQGQSHFLSEVSYCEKRNARPSAAGPNVLC